MTENEIKKILNLINPNAAKLFDTLPDEDKAWLVQCVEELKKSGKSSAFEYMQQMDYERIPVSAEQFLEDPYYLGGTNTWPRWKEEIAYICNPMNRIHEAILGGSIGAGKTASAMRILIYKLYELSCLRHPTAYFGLDVNSPVVIGIYNATLKLKDVGVGTLKGLLETSPYFREKFWFKEEYGDIHFPKNIKILTGSSSLHALGSNLFAACIDECNFHSETKAQKRSKTMQEKGKIHELVRAISERVKSRFMQGGRNAGLMLHVSSANMSTSYLELRKKEVADDPGVHVVEGPQWTFQPPEKRPSGKFFRFLVGNRLHPPKCIDKVIADGFGTYEIIRGEDPPRTLRVIDVPVEDYMSFEENPIEAMRDVAGIPSEALNPLFPREKPLIHAVNPNLPHPFIEGAGSLWERPIRIDLDSPMRVEDYVDKDLLLTIRNSREIPKNSSYSPRYLHCDLGSKKDALGLSMVYPSSAVMKTTRNESGEFVRNMEIAIGVDFAIQIKPKDTEVDWSKVREFILWLRDKGFAIQRVTYDSPASEGEIKYMKAAGVDSKYLSVDKKPDAYYTLKTMINEGRIFWPYNPVLHDELLGLEIQEDGKIDHSPGSCFVGETRIPLLDGTIPTISELAGKEDIWVYSSTTDGKIVPGRAKGRLTKYVTELVDVILDSGAVARCTPEHLWMLRDGTYKQAKDLVPCIDRLMPISRQYPRNGNYEGLTNTLGARDVTHRIVYAAINGEIPDGNVVHHINGDSLDNRPENLSLISKEEHSRKHTIERHENDPEYKKKTSDGLQRFNLSEEGRQKHREALIRTNSLKTPEDHRKSREKTLYFRHDITLDKIEGTKLSGATNANQSAHMLNCGRNVIIRVLKDHGHKDWRKYYQEETGNNHKVRYIVPVKLENPVPVYDLEVEEYHNFALSIGVFVHNSKDCADSLSGAVICCLSDDKLGTLVTPTESDTISYTEHILGKVKEMLAKDEEKNS